MKLCLVKFISSAGYSGAEMLLLLSFNAATTATRGDSGLDATHIASTPHNASFRIRERKRVASAISISRFLKASRLKMTIFRRMLHTFSVKRACRMIRRFPSSLPPRRLQFIPKLEIAWLIF
jgi:hypothetical protein